jgi:heat shock protein HtpX
MFKRFGLFFGMNIAIILTISTITTVLGFNQYITDVGIDYASLAGFCLIWGMVGSFISLFLSKFMVKMTMGVQVFGQEVVDQKLQWLFTTTQHLSQQAGLSNMPELGIYPGNEINAFATGATSNSALMAISQGALENLSEEELEGIIGHELAHIKNGDMVTMALVQGVMNAFVMFFARIIAFAIQNFIRGEDDEDEAPGLVNGVAYHLTVYVLQVVFGFFAMFIVAYFSRIREFSADRDGANIAGKGKMLAALKALDRTYEALPASADNIKCFKMSSPKSFMELLSTHPPLGERIAELEKEL